MKKKKFCKKILVCGVCEWCVSGVVKKRFYEKYFLCVWRKVFCNRRPESAGPQSVPPRGPQNRPFLGVPARAPKWPVIGVPNESFIKDPERRPRSGPPQKQGVWGVYIYPQKQR